MNRTARSKKPQRKAPRATAPTLRFPKPVFFRPCWADINHAALRHNFRQIKSLLSPGTSVLAVVKANAYGHGMVEVSKTLSAEGARFLGITSVEEGLALKKAGVRVPSLILGSVFPFDSLETAIRNGVRISVASLESARQCGVWARKLGIKAYAHAKVDTGMNRTGIRVDHAWDLVEAIRSTKGVALEGVYTHFSDSAEDEEFTRRQSGLFTDFAASLSARGLSVPFVHCANSAAIVKYPDTHFTLARPGISLYGFSPAPDPRLNLQPVLSWKSRIVFLKDVPAGTPVSYARTFVTKRKSRIATAAFGYADGFRRSLSNRAEVLVRGRRVKVIGRVTMDMTMLDVTDVPGANVGDEVVLLGRQGSEEIPVQELASRLDTSPYETFCGVTARVPRVHGEGV